MNFTQAMDLLAAPDGGFTATLSPNWGQGRAGFGGLIMALALSAIRRHTGLTWPLRALTVAFVGPVTGALGIQVRPLRVGRSAAFVEASVFAAGGDVGATVTTCLGPDRDSVLDLSAPAGPTVRPPDECSPLPLIEGVTPAFLGNLDVRVANGTVFRDGDTTELLWWARHSDAAARQSEAGFLALLDTLPPAAVALMNRPAPLSSLTWMVDLPTADFTTDDGWYLLRSAADYAGGGFSGQTMQAWTRTGRLVALHRQSVAIFG